MSNMVEVERSTEAVVLDIDPYSLDILRNPYPFHHQLREAGPVVLIKPYGVYAVGRHVECAEVLSDNTRFTSSGGVGIKDIRTPGNLRVPNRLLETDPPEHTDIRRTMTKYLSPIVVRRWRELFETEAARLVQTMVEKGEFDAMEELAEPFVLKVFGEAFGVDLPREKILAIGQMRFNQNGPPNELYQEATKRAQPYLEWYENSARRKNVVKGSIAEMLFEAEDRGEFEPGIASNMVLTLIGGGTDSTFSAIGHTLHLLAQHPDQWALLRSDPTRVKAAFEDALRLETPFQIIYRTTVAEVALSGVRLNPNTKIGVFAGAANRDPRRWPDPDKFDVTRDTTGAHLGFGIGRHVCIGQMIARLESEAVLKALVKAADRLELAGEIRYRPVNQMRQIDRLPLRVRKA